MHITARIKAFCLQQPEQALVVVASLLIFIGFTCSRALVSIGMIALLPAPFLRGNLTGIKAYFKSPVWWVISFYFFIVFFSGAYSDNKADWLNWVRIKLPYLALPVVFAALKKLENKSFVAILYGYLLTFSVSTAIILLRYYQHFDQINASFLRGSALAIPYSHIRYSLMVAFSFFCSIYLWQHKLYLWHRAERYGQLMLGAFAFVSLHLLSVRSGLLALYAGLLYLAVVFILREKKFILGLSLVVLSIVIPVSAYFTVPGLHNKIGYMVYDLGQYQQGRINNNSDAMRIASMKVGLKIWQAHPVWGCGAGDLKAACAGIYQSDYPSVTPENYRLPHNQFIWVLATTGVFGLVLFLLAFFVPLIQTQLYRHWLAVVFSLILFSSFFTEHSLEEQMGTGFYLIFLLLLMNRFAK